MASTPNRISTTSGLGIAVWLLLLSVAGCQRDTDNGRSVEKPNDSSQGYRETRTIQAVVNAKPLRFLATPQSEDSIVIGLDADMTSGSATSGEAIRRGIDLAIGEINRSGGLLGRRMELVVRDHRGNPDRGTNNIREFAEMRNVVAVMGGIHTPVALQELSVIHEEKIVYLVPWAAGTPIVSNGYSPNYVFRVSVRDEYAGGFLVRKAIERNYSKIGLLLERTGWGRSNEIAMVQALNDHDMEPVEVAWLNWGESDLSNQIDRLHDAGADAILLVANSLEGHAAIKAIANIPSSRRPAVVSHWGISAGNFFDLARDDLQRIDLQFLQTHSFIRPRYPERSKALFEAYRKRYKDCESTRDVFAPAGSAHAYELVNMLALAIKNAQSTASDDVRIALEGLRDFRGVMRDYERPFPPDHHDALNAEDFILAEFADDGAIVPVSTVVESGDGR